VEMMVW
jgi:hypothetical protein